MADDIRSEFMVFFSEGAEGIGAVRETSDDTLSVYIENCGEFLVPRSAVKAVHDGKVILDRDRVSEKFLRAVSVSHAGEDPRLAG
jgi:hypothetical protein